MRQLDTKSKPTNAHKCIMYFHALMCIVGFDFRMSRNKLAGIIQNCRPAEEGTRGDYWRDFRLCETKTVQPVAEIHNKHIVIFIIIIIIVVSEIANSVYL